MDPATCDLAACNTAARLALVEDLSQLDESQLDTQSLCHSWSVREVLAHLVTPYLSPPAGVLLEAARRRSFSRAMEAKALEVSRRPIDAQLDALRASAEKPFVPPLLGLGAPLTDAVVHGEDVRVPLGLERAVPPDHLRAVLGFGTSWRASPMFIGFRKLAGIRFVATDIGWSAGRGELVEGEGQQVMRAMFGRSAAAENLRGDGVELLAARFGAP